MVNLCATLHSFRMLTHRPTGFRALSGAHPLRPKTGQIWGWVLRFWIPVWDPTDSDTPPALSLQNTILTTTGILSQHVTSWWPKGVLTGWFPIFRMWCLFQVPDRCLELWYLHGPQQHAEVCNICDWYLIVCFCVNISLIIIGLTITSEFRWMEGRMEMDGCWWIWMDGDGWMEMDGWMNRGMDS